MDFLNGIHNTSRNRTLQSLCWALSRSPSRDCFSSAGRNSYNYCTLKDAVAGISRSLFLRDSLIN